MNRFLIVSILSVASTFVPGEVALTQEAPPPWGYPVNPPDFKPPPDDGTLRRVPDSTAACQFLCKPRPLMARAERTMQCDRGARDA